MKNLMIGNPPVRVMKIAEFHYSLNATKASHLSFWKDGDEELNFLIAVLHILTYN